MDNKTYFVVSLSIAFVVPVLIGGSYFMNVYNYKNSSQYLSSLEEMPEVIVLGDAKISRDELKSTEAREPREQYEAYFSIKYANGKESSYEYGLALQNVQLSPNIDYKDLDWELLYYDLESQTFKLLNMGNFEMLSDGKLSLCQDLNIDLRDTQDYIFRYKFNENSTYNRGFIDAEVVVE